MSSWYKGRSSQRGARARLRGIRGKDGGGLFQAVQKGFEQLPYGHKGIVIEQRSHPLPQGPESALAPLKCNVIQSSSDEAPGLLEYVEHHLGAHHSPDIFHVQPELSKTVAAPMAAKQATYQMTFWSRSMGPAWA